MEPYFHKIHIFFANFRKFSDKKRNFALVWSLCFLFISDLIPFGWGQEEDTNGMLNDDGIDTATLKDDDVYAGNPHHILEIRADFTDENPHITMKALNSIEADAENDDQESIPKEIFDESLRYSGVDRPKFSINRSSPLPQRRGSFMDPEEKIANLFATQGSRV